MLKTISERHIKKSKNKFSKKYQTVRTISVEIVKKEKK
jgi:hypothetical protein